MGDMKSAATLLELLKPPFHHDGTSTGMVYDGNTRLLDIRGWGFFQYYENGEQLQDEFKEFVVQALNEKWKREKLYNWETPEEYENRTGRPWADDSAVYMKIGMNDWRIKTYREAKFDAECCQGDDAYIIYCANSDSGIPEKDEIKNKEKTNDRN